MLTKDPVFVNEMKSVKSFICNFTIAKAKIVIYNTGATQIMAKGGRENDRY
jgi:hypothetical protein